MKTILFLLPLCVAFLGHARTEMPNKVESAAAPGKPAATVAKAVFQYKAGDIAIPTATADEPKVAAFGAESIRAAAKYLDDGASAWARSRSCMACHTTGVYMAERTVLTKLLGPPRDEILGDFVADIPAEGDETTKTQPHAFSVWRSLGLAQWDRHVAGKLSEHTQRSLRDMLLRLPGDGFYHTVSKVEIPYTTTNFELTVQAARSIAAAPGWLAGLTDNDLKGRLQRMKTALAAYQPRHDYERALLLQLAVAMPELVPQQARDEAISVLWKHQRDDGGWSTRSFSEVTNWGPYIRPETVAMLQAEPDAADPAGDAYMTAFAIILLRENNVPADDPRIQRGIAWLKSGQRASGRWWMKSLYKDTLHFSTYIATAHALRALALCGEIHYGKVPVR